jgi:hypothetical protein
MARGGVEHHLQLGVLDILRTRKETLFPVLARFDEIVQRVDNVVVAHRHGILLQ